MNLELRSIIEAGNLDKERLTLRALADLDLGDYLVAQIATVRGHPATTFYHSFWFQFKEISKGDLVVLYSKRGKESGRALKRGTTAHFFYLDLSKPIWSDEETAALVLYAPTWESKLTEELRK